MPTPRDQGQKYNKGSGEPRYCGTCGTPDCVCMNYKEWGSKGSTKAGSASGDDKFMGKVAAKGADEKGEGTSKAPPSGKKEE